MIRHTTPIFSIQQLRKYYPMNTYFHSAMSLSMWLCSALSTGSRLPSRSDTSQPSSALLQRDVPLQTDNVPAGFLRPIYCCPFGSRHSCCCQVYEACPASNLSCNVLTKVKHLEVRVYRIAKGHKTLNAESTVDQLSIELCTNGMSLSMLAHCFIMIWRAVSKP